MSPKRDMGGRCYFFKENKNGSLVKYYAPYCTDNFQIVSTKFSHAGYRWHSVEQAFQSLKFPMGSRLQVQIYEESPCNGESYDDYGNRVWRMGQTKGTVIVENWDKVGKKIMLILNLQKYISQDSFQNDLLKTLPHDLFANPSTADWEYFNKQIQLLIRGYLSNKKSLRDVLEDVEKMSTDDVLELLKNVS